mmetsp:Transcript_14514/g.18956  ORF Transcript_14514/g.18956 Transcript_14514/m.18956 type:complete len:539 (+) Transcript_14514:142-1758(+)
MTSKASFHILRQSVRYQAHQSRYATVHDRAKVAIRLSPVRLYSYTNTLRQDHHAAESNLNQSLTGHNRNLSLNKDSTRTSVGQQTEERFYMQAIKAKEQLKAILHGTRKGSVMERDGQSFIDIQETVMKRIMLTDDHQIDPAFAAKLINMSAQYSTIRPGSPQQREIGIKYAYDLFWHLVNKKEKYLGDDMESNSAFFCDTFSTLAYVMREPKQVGMVEKMVHALQNLAATENSRFQLTTHAINRMMKHYTKTNNFRKTLQLLDYMIESWKQGNRFRAPNLASFNIALHHCNELGDVERATDVVHDMVKLYEQGQTSELPRPDENSIMHVLTAYTKRPHPLAGARAEAFLRWALERHEDGMADLVDIRLSSAMGRVLEAWSKSGSPESGPRTDNLMQRILDQYTAGGRVPEESPVALQFAFNANAWITSCQYIQNDKTGVVVEDKVRAVLQKMEQFGINEKWSSAQYWKFFWSVMNTLEVARIGENKDKIQALALMHEFTNSMDRLNLNKERVMQKFPILSGEVANEKLYSLHDTKQN